MNRCPWARGELLTVYHDQEWGVPLYEDHRLFEFLILEGAQAGLSWDTILKKRTEYREVFDDFDPQRVVNFDQNRINSLLSNPGIIRNRRKIESAIKNAQVFLKIQDEFGSFNQFLWRFVDGTPIKNHFLSMTEIPAETELSKLISWDLKQRGMSFVGPTIIYAFMQAVGLVNDHLVDCYRYNEIIHMEKMRNA